MTIVGSSGSSSSSSDGDSQNLTGGSGNPVDMNGTWVEACTPTAEGDKGESEQYVNTLSGSSFTNTTKMWVSSTTCAGDPDIVVIMKGTFTLGETVTAGFGGSNVTATKVDVVADSYTATIKNSDLITGFNQDKECDFDNWEVNKPKELIENTKCGPDSTTFKDIVYIDDAADPDLWYGGDDGAGVDADGYPTTLDDSNPAERS